MRLAILFLIGFTPYLQAQGKLEIIVVPTAKPLNWETPTKLQYAFLRTYFQTLIAEEFYNLERTALGHGIVRAQCFTGEEEVDFWSGFNGNKNKVALKLTLQGAGLSVLTYHYSDGHVQSPEFIQKYLKDILKQSDINPAFIRMNVNQEQCRRIKQHYDAFRNNKKPGYGFFTNPDNAEGAGCTTYAVSYIRKAGLMHAYLEQKWFREVRISTRHLGPTDQVDMIEGIPLEPISMFRFLIPFMPTRWYKKGDTVISFSYPDPQLMIDFMHLSMDCLQDQSACHKDNKLKKWLIEHKARLATNEYMDGIEITID